MATRLIEKWLLKAGGEPSPPAKHSHLLLVVAVAVSVAAFCIDLVTPRGVAAGVFPHLIAIALTSWTSNRFVPFALAALATIFTLVGFALTAGGTTQIVMVNRAFLIAGYWLFAFLVHLKQRADWKLRRGYADLEQMVTARTQALEESESRLRLITNRLPALIAYVGADQRYRFINAHYEEALGRPKGRPFGRHVYEVLGDEAYAIVKPNVERVLSGQTVRCTIDLPNQKGRRNFRVTYLPDWNEDKKVTGFVLLALDVTEEQEQQLQRRQS
ncbi:MAG: PAS domain-containing protein [Kiloniellaceae bacterium]